MRYLITALMVLMVLVPQVHSDLNLLPTDGTSTSTSGNIYWFMNFGGLAPTWPDTDDCLVSTGGGNAYRGCGALVTPDHRNGTPYFGQVFVRYLVCTAMKDHLAWGSAASLSLAVYETQGSANGADFFRNKLGGDVTFDETDAMGFSARVVINQPTTLSGGTLQVKFSVVSAAPSVPVDNGFSCVIALVE